MRSTLTSAVCLGALLWAAGVAAQGAASPNEETVVGTIEALRHDGLEGCELCEGCSDCAAAHVLLRTRARRVEVHLAPAWFLDALEFNPVVGDQLTVTGSRVRLPKARGIAAREVRLGNTLFRLRDEQGLPMWRRSVTESREPAADGRASFAHR